MLGQFWLPKARQYLRIVKGTVTMLVSQPSPLSTPSTTAKENPPLNMEMDVPMSPTPVEPMVAAR